MEPEIVKLSVGVTRLIRLKEAELQAQIKNYIEADLSSREIELPQCKWNLSQDRSHILVERFDTDSRVLKAVKS